jgi:hypothetical protein
MDTKISFLIPGLQNMKEGLKKMPKPENYPLPWCEALDCPYWQINLILSATNPAHGKWQAHRPMSEIVPKIDEMIQNGEIEPLDPK